MARIVIVDDQPVIRAGLRALLQQLPAPATITEIARANDALHHIQTCKTDLVILEISLPGRDGFQLLEDIRTLHARTGVLVYTRHSEEEYGIRALKAGANGFVSKADSIEDLITAIKKVSAGGKYISPKLAALLADRLEAPFSESPHDRLSNREDHVMRKIAAGHSLKSIAEDLCVSSKTVSTYRARILGKMHMRSNADLVRYIVERESGVNGKPRSRTALATERG
jgi:two-component system invasion response regulator UvrY